MRHVPLSPTFSPKNAADLPLESPFSEFQLPAELKEARLPRAPLPPHIKPTPAEIAALRHRQEQELACLKVSVPPAYRFYRQLFNTLKQKMRALQLLDAEVFELQPGPCGQVAHKMESGANILNNALGAVPLLNILVGAISLLLNLTALLLTEIDHRLHKKRYYALQEHFDHSLKANWYILFEFVARKSSVLLQHLLSDLAHSPTFGSLELRKLCNTLADQILDQLSQQAADEFQNRGCALIAELIEHAIFFDIFKSAYQRHYHETLEPDCFAALCAPLEGITTPNREPRLTTINCQEGHVASSPGMGFFEPFYPIQETEIMYKPKVERPMEPYNASLMAYKPKIERQIEAYNASLMKYHQETYQTMAIMQEQLAQAQQRIQQLERQQASPLPGACDNGEPPQPASNGALPQYGAALDPRAPNEPHLMPLPGSGVHNRCPPQ